MTMPNLTELVSCAGCASKLAAGELANALNDLPMETDPRVLIDFRTSDDAGVYRWTGGPALVQTVDFFTPIVDDPFTYGQIAAANALSDVYAMGGEPMTALAIAAFPQDALDRETIRAIFLGGLDKLKEAGAALLGGHTVRDPEVKFGYAVTGAIDPDRIWANAGARIGDQLIFTKRLGTGIVGTAIKNKRAPQTLVDQAVTSMTTLNKVSARVLREFGDAVHASTDVTGFSMIGHSSEMAAASGVTVVLYASRLAALRRCAGDRRAESIGRHEHQPRALLAAPSCQRRVAGAPRRMFRSPDVRRLARIGGWRSRRCDRGPAAERRHRCSNHR